MDSKLRKRKGPANELPSSLANPQPEPNHGHATSSRQGPTIAPTVFLFVILGFLLALPPIFYYTQVMIPDPESSSFISQFRIKGNILLNALGHTTSSGHGRIPFSPVNPASKTHQTPKTESGHKIHQNLPGSSGEKLQKSSQLEHENHSTANNHPPASAQKTLEDDSNPKGPMISALPSAEAPPEISKKREEEERKLEEELGKFWEASSRYRKEAQKQKAGEYSLQGDGSVGPKDDQATHSDRDFLDDLPPADPDAKEGLTPEVWEAIKDQLSADDLTVVLNQMRLKEQAATST